MSNNYVTGNNTSTNGWLNGTIGVLIFSGSLPATKAAVEDFDPIFLTVARASIAGFLALIALMLYKVKRPELNQVFMIIIVSVGVVIGFPLLTALALRHITSAHAIVFIGLLPLVTAIFGVIRGGEHPERAFWIFSVLGSTLVIGYAVSQGFQASFAGDLLMLGAIILCGAGYAEGAKLSKIIGGWQVISWALLLSLPLMLVLSIIYLPSSLAKVTTPAWIGLAYVSIFSMFIGFVFWYKGLAQGGTAIVGQLQLLQPFFGLALAAFLLHEKVSIGMLAVTVGVIMCVARNKEIC